MLKCVLTLALGLSLTVTAATLVTPEAHFLGIPNADSLSFEWFMQMSQDSNPGPWAPIGIDVLRLSPSDYRMVMLDGARGTFLEFRLDQQSSLDWHKLAYSGETPDSLCGATAMCRMQSGTYFNPLTDRVAVTFDSCAKIGVYRFDAVSGQFTIERGFSTPAPRPVGIFWALEAQPRTGVFQRAITP
jgi:hypothetical protein